MNQYKPSVAKQTAVMCSMFVLVLPAIAASGLAYIHFLSNGLGVDMEAKPENLLDVAVMILSVLPMMAVMLTAIFVTGSIWMMIMSKVLPWPDIQYYTQMEGPRYPWISVTLDRMWKSMLTRRKHREAQQANAAYRR